MAPPQGEKGAQIEGMLTKASRSSHSSDVGLRYVVSPLQQLHGIECFYVRSLEKIRVSKLVPSCRCGRSWASPQRGDVFRGMSPPWGSLVRNRGEIGVREDRIPGIRHPFGVTIPWLRFYHPRGVTTSSPTNGTCTAAIAKEERPNEQVSRVPTGRTTTPGQQMADASRMEEESECVEPILECLGEEDEVFNLVDELQGSTMMRTRDRYKSSTCMFLLHLYHRNHPALNPAFAQEMKKVLEGPRPRGRCTDGTLIHDLLPGYSQSRPLEPLLWERVTPEVILAPIANLRRENSKTSDSKINAYRAAIHLLFKDFGKTSVWQTIAPTVSTIIHGWKKRIARKRKEDGVEAKRGMTALPFKLYALICKQLAQHKLIGPFAWCYATLLWNLMCRSDNISYINLGHIKYKDDHLLMYFAHSKTDQEGKLAKYPRAIYANPLEPWICPVTALGVYLICISACVGGPSTGVPLFQGNQENCARRFRACLSSEVKRLSARLEELGLIEEDIGTHSFRKGAATYASAGGTACPSSSSISLRAGWSQPGVEDTYRRFDAAGDEHVGRVVNGLRMHHEELAL
eukprot:scaffold927_cov310-Pavlova_lutheri.AAC.6